MCLISWSIPQREKRFSPDQKEPIILGCIKTDKNPHPRYNGTHRRHEAVPLDRTAAK
jgi:hypothetical protein